MSMAADDQVHLQCTYIFEQATHDHEWFLLFRSEGRKIMLSTNRAIVVYVTIYIFVTSGICLAVTIQKMAQHDQHVDLAMTLMWDKQTKKNLRSHRSHTTNQISKPQIDHRRQRCLVRQRHRIYINDLCVISRPILMVVCFGKLRPICVVSHIYIYNVDIMQRQSGFKNV